MPDAVVGGRRLRKEGPMLSQDDLRYFEELLKSQLADLSAKADGTVTDLLMLSVYAADPMDTLSMETDRGYMLRMRDREHKLIRKIKAALKRIEEGTYGECDSCGEPIAIARLRARPVTTYCIGCKTKMETMERVAGF
jgi:DnaK suppressor protein